MFKLLADFKTTTVKVANKRFWNIPLPFFLVIILSLIALQGHVYHPEADYSMHNYFQNKPFLYKIFDAEGPYGYNFAAFQAREFSYLANYIDAYFILLTSFLGVVQFYSLTHYILIFVIAYLAFMMSKRYFGQPFYYVSLLLSLLYLASPGPFLSGYNYRTSKILVSFFIVFLSYLMLSYVDQKKHSAKYPFLILLSTFFMATSDKEGYYFAGIFTFISFGVLLLDRSLRTLNLFLAYVIAAVSATYYSHTLGPLIIQHYIGRYPTFVPDTSYLSYLGAIKYHFKSAWLYAAYQTSYFFGNLGTTLGYVLTVLLSMVYLGIFLIIPAKEGSVYRKSRIKKLTLFVPLLLLATLPFLTFMFSYSLLFLTLSDLRLIYYNLPLVTLILLFSQLLFARLLSITPRLYKPVLVLLVAALLLNLFGLVTHYNVLKNGHLKVQFTSTRYLAKCIAERSLPEKNFTGYMSQHHDEACILFRSILGEHVKLEDKQNPRLSPCKNEWLVTILMSLRFPNWLLR